jgi:hypothetical protein
MSIKHLEVWCPSGSGRLFLNTLLTQQTCLIPDNHVLRFSDIDRINGFLRIAPIAVRITLINVRCFPPVKSGSHEITPLLSGYCSFR